jgi:hypothetical protein
VRRKKQRALSFRFRTSRLRAIFFSPKRRPLVKKREEKVLSGFFFRDDAEEEHGRRDENDENVVRVRHDDDEMSVCGGWFVASFSFLFSRARCLLRVFLLNFYSSLLK